VYSPKNTCSNEVIAVKMVADIVRMGSIKKAEGLRINKKILSLSLQHNNTIVYSVFKISIKLE